MLEKAFSLLESLIQRFAWGGMLLLVFAVVVTFIDVVSRKTTGWSIKGVVEIVQLAVMCAAFSAIPFAFSAHKHVSVDVFAERFSVKVKAVTEALSLICSLTLMSSIAYFGTQQGLLEWSYNDTTMTLGLSKVYYWIPLVTGSGLSVAWLLLHISIRLNSAYIFLKNSQ
ncbi:MAG: TRAP transporter small permease [Gammaproteobacteria bacterium]|nr:TRAP transporter small permease [Gammaproteobacteria bacterium]